MMRSESPILATAVTGRCLEPPTAFLSALRPVLRRGRGCPSLRRLRRFAPSRVLGHQWRLRHADRTQSRPTGPGLHIRLEIPRRPGAPSRRGSPHHRAASSTRANPLPGSPAPTRFTRRARDGRQPAPLTRSHATVSPAPLRPPTWRTGAPKATPSHLPTPPAPRLLVCSGCRRTGHWRGVRCCLAFRATLRRRFQTRRTRAHRHRHCSRQFHLSRNSLRFAFSGPDCHHGNHHPGGHRLDWPRQVLRRRDAHRPGHRRLSQRPHRSRCGKRRHRLHRRWYRSPGDRWPARCRGPHLVEGRNEAR